MDVVLFLQILMYILGSILLVVLIVLGIKMIVTMNKLEKTVDNINTKLDSLNKLFSIIDVATDKLALVSDKAIDTISSFISRIFSKKKRKEDENYE